jgi:hypothetical protein
MPGDVVKVCLHYSTLLYSTVEGYVEN